MGIATNDKRIQVIKFKDVPLGGLFDFWDDYNENSYGVVCVKLSEGIVVDAEDTDFEYNTFNVSDCTLRGIDDNISVILIHEVEVTILQ